MKPHSIVLSLLAGVILLGGLSFVVWKFPPQAMIDKPDRSSTPNTSSQPVLDTSSPDTPVVLSTSEVSFIDTHTHLDRKSAATFEESFLVSAERFVALMEDYHVKTALLMPPPQKEGQENTYDYEAFQEVLAQYPDTFKLVAGGGSLNKMITTVDADEVTDDVRKSFRAKAQELIDIGVVGFGEMTAMHLCMNDTHQYVAAPPDHPLFLELADLAAQYNVPIDLHMEAIQKDIPTPRSYLERCAKNPETLPATIPGLRRLLEHNPKANIVWQHMGWDLTGERSPDVLRELLETYDNLYLAIRVLTKEELSRGLIFHPIVDVNGKTDNDWVELMQDFPDRFVVGSDEFITGSESVAAKSESFKPTWTFVSTLDPSLAYKIGYANAARLYHLE